MEQSHLIELIRTLSHAEKADVLQFATISFFNNGRMKAQVVPLLEICLNYPWGDFSQTLDKKSVYDAIFTNQEYVAGKLEKVMVEAHKVVRSYLLTKGYFQEEKEFQQVFDFTEILRTRGLSARYQQSMAKLKKLQSECLTWSPSHYHQQLLLEGSIHYVESLNNQKKGDINIPNLLDSIESYYFLRRVMLLNRYLLQQRVTKLEVPAFINDHLADNKIPERYLSKSPLLKTYYEIFLLLKKDILQIEDIRYLYDLLLIHEEKFDGETLQEFYGYLRNFVILLLNTNRDNDEICHILHELYLDNLERGYLHYEGKLSSGRYAAVSANALKIKQLDWANSFLEKYKNDIYGENETHDIYRFNKAHYLFAIGQYDECLSIIPATSTFVDYMVSGKRLELKAYYELQSDLLPYKLDAFKMFISRTSQKLLSDSLIKTNSEFANLLYQLMTSIPGDKKRADLLIERIEKKKQALEWRWLLAKAHAL